MELVEDYKLEMDQDLYDETKRQIKKTDFKLEEEKRRQKKLEQQKIGQKKKI